MKFLSSTGKRASRALALILSLMLLLTMTTVPAFAADGTATDPANFEYYYDDYEETVEIAGYVGDDKDTMTELVIPEEIDGAAVTLIDGNAFAYCASLEKVTIPESVTNIEYSAFYDCPNLKAVTIPASVASIGNYAFGYYADEEDYDYIKMDDFTITGYKYSAAYRYAMENDFEFVSLGEVNPFVYEELDDEIIEITGYNGNEAKLDIPAEIDGKRVSEIGYNAFKNCKSITSVTIPDGVTYINSSAFEDCVNIASVTIPDSVTNIGDYTFANCTSLTDVTIPTGVIGIGDYAFENCTSLTGATISDSVEEIGEEAFYYCPNLKAVTIPASVTEVGDNAFGYCSGYWDENDNYVDGKVDGFTITGYKNSAAYRYAIENGFEFVSLGEVSPFVYYELYDGTIAITGYNGYEAQINIPAKIDGKKVTEIRDYAFKNCTSLTSVIIPDSVTAIENDAFGNCTSLTSVTIPDGVTSIGDNAFGYYEDEETGNDIKVEGFTITGYKNSAAYRYAIENGFEFVSLGEVSPFVYYELYDGTIAITGYNGYEAQINIPAKIDGKKVTEIRDYAFKNCTSLTSVTIPDGVTYIGDNAFYSCTNLNSVTIPESVANIYYDAFYNCPSLKTVTIPASVTSIGNEAFGYYRGEETWEDIKIDGFTITGYKNSAAYAYARDNEFDFTSLGEVDPLAYEELEDGNLELVAYYGDKEELTKLDIPAEIDGKKVAEIGESAFRGCTSLTSVTIPEGLSVIGGYAFHGCTSLKTVTIPKSVIKIHRYAFGYYSSYDVLAIKIEDFKITGYTNSAAYAYARAREFEFTSLGEVNPFAGKELGDGTLELIAYYGDKDGLTDVSIPAELGGKSVTSMTYDAFGGCTSLKSVSTPSSLKKIGHHSFSGCKSLENVTLSSGLTTIEFDAFYNCPNLKSVMIPASVTEIGSNAFGYNGYTKVEGFTIKGYAGTEAERYAKDNGFEFIALEEKKSGDIDGSGAVDAKDRMTITRYIAKWKGYESIDKTAADVNSDGEVDAADRMIITRHIAKWKGYETLPYVADKTN